ncbi:MAG: hypothetical protein HY721_34665 [Planctomycetes bacterium]|nr:hypothetical protein [Planctomycetota bacterium]
MTGAGLYRQGGEVALLQQMDLLVKIDATPGIDMASGLVPVEVKPPRISIDLRQENAASPASVWSLRIVARPLEGDGPPGPLDEVPFVRGDSTADGEIEIADAIGALMYLFLGGIDLPCLEAADSNDSGELDIADAVFTLTYLLLGGSAPPAPFPDCGLDPTKDPLGCESFPPCEGDKPAPYRYLVCMTVFQDALRFPSGPSEVVAERVSIVLANAFGRFETAGYGEWVAFTTRPQVWFDPDGTRYETTGFRIAYSFTWLNAHGTHWGGRHRVRDQGQSTLYDFFIPAIPIWGGSVTREESPASKLKPARTYEMSVGVDLIVGGG